MRKLQSALALALAVGQMAHTLTAPDLNGPEGNDPYKPRPRSKGEKARNRGTRRGR